MSTRRTSRVPRAFAVTAAAAAALTLSSASALASNPAASSGRVDSSADGRADRHDRRHHARETQIQLLSFNDLHGNLEPPAGSGGRITTGYTESTTTPPAALPTTVDAGGTEYLATHLKAARQGHRNTATVAAGDLIGASPLLSAAFHDEPTIEAMNLLGLQYTSVGNHEFDEGPDELLRMQNGDCPPVDGGADGDGFAGAKFQYLSANAFETDTGQPLLPPYAVH